MKQDLSAKGIFEKLAKDGILVTQEDAEKTSKIAKKVNELCRVWLDIVQLKLINDDTLNYDEAAVVASVASVNLMAMLNKADPHFKQRKQRIINEIVSILNSD